MMRRLVWTACAMAALILVPGASAIGGLPMRAADRTWQTGKWIEVKVTRPRVTIGLSGRPFGGGAPQDARVTEYRTYVIETDDLRLELREPVPPPQRAVDALVGLSVTFAIEKKIVYVRDEDGTEHRLDVTRQSKKRRP